MAPLDMLRHHVTGAIERGEAQPITAVLPPAEKLAKPRPFSALYNRCTSYEAGLFDPWGALVAILAYDPKRTKRALFSAMVRHGPAVLRFTAMGESEEFEWKGGAWRLGARGWHVGWTGATEYQRASEIALQQGS
jgi:hypothetical protein